MGGETNTIYRPDPAKTNLDPNEVPVWDEDFYQNYGAQWISKMAYDPKGVDNKGNEKLPTLGDQSACNATQCEELSTGELQELWKTYGAKFDGVFKRSNGNYYFFRNPVNEIPPSPAICGNGVTLKTSLTRTEADVLEVWTSLSEHDLARCETAPDGGGTYKVVLKDGEPNKIVEELDKLIAALQWKKANPGKTDNPHNPNRLPLDISLDRAKSLKEFFNDQGTAWYKSPLNLALTGVGLLVGGYLTGLGFAAASEHIKKWLRGGDGDGGTPTGGGRGGEPKMVYDGFQDKMIPNPVLSLALGLFESTVAFQVPQAASNVVFRFNQAMATVGNTLANPAPVLNRAMAFMESAMPVSRLVPVGAGVGAMPGVTVPETVPVTTPPRPVVSSRPAARFSGVGTAGRALGVMGLGLQFLNFYYVGKDRGVDCKGFLGALRCIDSGADRFLFGPKEWELTPEQRYYRDFVAGGA